MCAKYHKRTASTGNGINGSKYIYYLRRLWLHVGNRRRIQLKIIFAITLVTSLAEVIGIGSVVPFLATIASADQALVGSKLKDVLRHLNFDSPYRLLILVTVGFVVCVLISGVMRIILLHMQTRLSHAVGADFSIEIYQRTLHQPYSVHVSRNSSELIAGIATKASSVVGTAILPLLILANSAFILFSIIVFLFFLQTTMAIVSIIGVVGIYTIIFLVARKILQANGKRISENQILVVKALQEGLGGIRDILIHGTQEYYCNTYRSADAPLRKAYANIAIISAIPRYAVEALGIALIAIISLMLSSGDSIGNTSIIPTLGAFALGAQRVLPLIQQIYSSATTILGGQENLKDILELLEQPMPQEVIKDANKHLTFSKNIELRNISFRYSQNNRLILKDVSLKINKGTRIGVIGATGCGKSTLLDLIMGLLNPTNGSLSIDGTELDRNNIRDWQEKIAHVPQNIFLSDASVAENIAFGNSLEKINLEQVRAAAAISKIADTVEAWPDKYLTKVGERGARLSGGQRQRIGIARALYRGAELIILDEATNALDEETEREILEALNNFSKEVTIIMVTHRMSTLKYCNELLKIKSNGIVKKIANEHVVSP